MELTNRSLPVSCTLLHDSFHDFCIPLKTPSLLFFNFMSHLVFVSSSAKLALVILLLSDYWLPPLLLLFLHQRKWNDDKSCFCSTSLCDYSLDFVSIIHFLHSYVTVCALQQCRSYSILLKWFVYANHMWHSFLSNEFLQLEWWKNAPNFCNLPEQ